MKAVVIRQKDNELSERLSDECIDSCKKFGITVEKVDGIYADHDKILEDLELFPYPKIIKKLRPGYKGCFLSHYMLWKTCLETNETLLIRPLPTDILDKFDTIINLDYASRIAEDYEAYLSSNHSFKIEKYPYTHGMTYPRINSTHIKGLHAYIIKPLGAKNLINSVKMHGYIAADVAINQYYTSYYVTIPSYARINPFFCNKKNKLAFSHTR